MNSSIHGRTLTVSVAETTDTPPLRLSRTTGPSVSQQARRHIQDRNVAPLGTMFSYKLILGGAKHKGAWFLCETAEAMPRASALPLGARLGRATQRSSPIIGRSSKMVAELRSGEAGRTHTTLILHGTGVVCENAGGGTAWDGRRRALLSRRCRSAPAPLPWAPPRARCGRRAPPRAEHLESQQGSGCHCPPTAWTCPACRRPPALAP